MSGRKHAGSIDCVAIDLNTQFDFCDVNGAYPVANASQLTLALREVMHWAIRHHIPVVSSLDSHRRWEITRENVPVHCVDGTAGQRKLDFTMLDPHKMIEGDNTLWVPIDLFTTMRQVIFRKRTRDFFANPKADRFLTQLQTQQYVVFGNGLESSVKNVALGLLTRHRKVSVVVDACGYWDKTEAELSLRQMEAKGVELITVSSLEDRIRPRASAPAPPPPDDPTCTAPLPDRPMNGTIHPNDRIDRRGHNRSPGCGRAQNGHASA